MQDHQPQKLDQYEVVDQNRSDQQYGIVCQHGEYLALNPVYCALGHTVRAMSAMLTPSREKRSLKK